VNLWPRTWKGWLGYGLVVLILIGALSGGSDDSQPAPVSETVTQSSSDDAARKEREAVQRERAELREERARIRRDRAEARRERARTRRARSAARKRERRAREIAAQREEQERLKAQALAQEQESAASCHPSYDPCLDPNASDYDCEGGEGDGPDYTGLVTVNGPDDYDLDRDGDGTGCDS
jgi:hypothetical protein